MNDNNSTLVRKALRGDQEALTLLFEEVGPRIRAEIGRRIPDRWSAVLTAEDVMQETYTDAFLDIGTFAGDDSESFERWLAKIAWNNLNDAIRGLSTKKRGGDRRPVLVGGPDESMRGLLSVLKVTMSTPSVKAGMLEHQYLLEDAINRLPQDYQLVVRGYDLRGETIDDLARQLNRRTGAVFMLRARAHRAMRQLLGGSSKFFSSSA